MTYSKVKSVIGMAMMSIFFIAMMPSNVSAQSRVQSRGISKKQNTQARAVTRNNNFSGQRGNNFSGRRNNVNSVRRSNFSSGRRSNYYSGRRSNYYYGGRSYYSSRRGYSCRY